MTIQQRAASIASRLDALVGEARALSNEMGDGASVSEAEYFEWTGAVSKLAWSSSALSVTAVACGEAATA